MHLGGLLHELPVFVAVADGGGFTDAAHALQLTPAGVSRAIARLEEEVGVTLFARTTRRVTLTEEGERFLAHAREALRQIEVGRVPPRPATPAARPRLHRRPLDPPRLVLKAPGAAAPSGAGAALESRRRQSAGEQ
ncbi:MAG: LysR family transcriptional regulator [Myxococcales bacterium]|nr:LysR family transcriptional regulator [Myxococcales bacterium]